MTRCEVHGLAVPPGGTCIVCRREARAHAGFPGWVLALAGLTLAGLVVFGVASTVLRRAESVAAATPPVVGPSPTVPSAASTTHAEPTAAPPSSALPAWYADEEARVPEERKRVSITIYTASWCAYCRAAKAWLSNHHQPFFERDIERDPEAKARMHALNPAGGVPTINVEDDILVGFDAPSLERAIDTAARRRIASARTP